MRYGRQQYSEIMAMPYDEMMRIYKALAKLLGEESALTSLNENE